MGLDSFLDRFSELDMVNFQNSIIVKWLKLQWTAVGI